MKFQSDETQWAADGARKILDIGIEIQGAEPVTNAVVAGLIKMLLDHIDNLKADPDVAILRCQNAPPR